MGAELGDLQMFTAVTAPIQVTPGSENAYTTLVQLVENSPFGVYIVDARFRLIHISAGARNVFENIKPLIGRDFAEILHIIWPEPFASEAIALFRHTLDTGEPYHAPSTVERREDIGEIESYDWKIDRLTLPDGTDGVVCHFYDLSVRQRYEEALRQGNSRQALAMDAAAMYSWEIDAASGRVDWSDNAVRVLGLPCDAMPTTVTQALSLSHPGDTAQIEREMAQLRNGTKSVFALEHRIVNPTDGAVVWVYSHGKVDAFHDTKGERIVGVSQNITERKRASDALRASERRFLAAFQQNPVPMGILDLEGRYLEANEALVEHSGYARDELSGNSTEQLEMFANRQDHDAYYHLLQTQTSVRSYPAAIRTRSGDVRNCLLSAEKIELDGLPCILAVRVDVTERVKLESARRESEARERVRTAELETIMQAVPTALWIAHDPQCLKITGNRESYRMLRMADGENISATAADANLRPFREYQNDIQVPPDQLPMQRAATLGIEVREQTLTLKFADGEERHIFGNAAPLFEEDGRVRGVVASFLDITRLRRAEAALIDANRRKDQFLAMLAHELRNPLGAMFNAVTLMSRSDIAQPPIKKMIEIIHRQVKHMTRLVDDLLDVSRLTQGKITLKKEKVKLSTVVDYAVEMAHSIIENLGHRLVVSLPSELIFVHVDAPRLAQAISNLLNNAAKYTPQGGEIRLSGEYQNDEITIRVRDNGIGIAADDLPEVFHLFSQADRSLDRAKGGLGIGLALVKSLIELHGGRVIAKSDGLGQGSEFTLHIPNGAESDQIDSAHDEVEQSAPSRQCILVVDDNEDSANSLATLLEFEGHKVEVAYGARSALDCAEVFQPDVVVLDIGLPQMDGYEVATVLRGKKETQGATLIALTGYGQKEDRERAKQAGFDHHFIKPLDTAKLIGILTRRQLS